MSKKNNSVTFASNVLNASAAIQAWKLEYDSGVQEYHTKGLEAEISNITYSAGRSPNVSFDVELLLDEIAPTYYNRKGLIRVLVIAYCE